MRTRRRMTAEEFEVVRARLERRTRINGMRLEAARLPLVDGVKFQAIAERFNWASRQTVNDVVRIAWNELAELQGEHQKMKALRETLRPSFTATTVLPPKGAHWTTMVAWLDAPA
jgi:hypothetical protein